MINEYKHTKDYKVNCLSFNIWQKEGYQKFIDIVNQAKFFTEKHYVPEIWPTPIDQKGPCCGIYALKIASEYSGLLAPGSIPPARKSDDAQSIDDEKKPKTSVRRFAKEDGLTDIGSIFKIQHFTTLAKRLGLKNTKEFKLKENETDYIEQLSKILESHHTIIIAADVHEEFPESTSGIGAHWALIFGYIYFHDECYFLATQYGRYYLWKGEDLFYSNLKLPLKNPNYGEYVKNHAKINQSDYEMANGEIDHLQKAKLRKIKERDLYDFRFCCFAVPSIYLKNKINDFPELIDEYTKSFILYNPVPKLIHKKRVLTNYFIYTTNIIDTNILNGGIKIAWKPHSEYFKYFSEILENIPNQHRHELFISFLNKHIKHLNYSTFCKFSIRKIIFLLDYFIKAGLLDEVLLVTPEEHLEFIKQLLGILLIKYVKSEEFKQIEYIFTVIPEINMDKNNKGQYLLTSTSKNNNVSLVSWLPVRNVSESVIDEKSHDCNFYLKINVTKLAKKNNCENIFKMAFEQKNNLFISNMCLVGCLTKLDYFFQLKNILNTYFEIREKISSVNILLINNKNKDVFKNILNEIKFELRTIKPERLSSFNIHLKKMASGSVSDYKHEEFETFGLWK